MMRGNIFALSLLHIMLFFSLGTAAQDTLPEPKRSKSKIISTAKDLETSLKKNDNTAIARNYEKLAQGFIDKGDWAKGEEYLKKALALYTKKNNTDDRARVSRNLAKVQESQNKLDDAIQNYKEASEVTEDKTSERANANDVKRLQNAANPQQQGEYLDANIYLLDKTSTKEEVADIYMQKAEVSLKNNDTKSALENYKKALPYANSKSEKAVKISNEIAKVYAAGNEFDKAINITQNVLTKAENDNDYNTQIAQLQYLASIYFKKGEPQKAVQTLRKSYDLAFEKGNTAGARESLSQLLTYYKSQGDDKNSMALYDEFFRNFETLIKADSTLIDAKTFQVTEERIRQLEGEKKLKDELISKKNMFNYVLLGSVLLLLLFFGLIVRALYAIKTKNKEIALQSLRREMNPHFIFNSLNSVNQFISQNNERKANKYLTSYSNLMRNMMENSNKDFVTLANEIEQLNKYLELEHLRFSDKFAYKINVDEQLDTETTYIPNMIIQPHLENAIWHGLRYLEDKGMLLLDFGLKNGKVIVTIDDNGIGLKKSAELKTKNQMVHQSRGITNTKERMTLLNELYKKEIHFTVSEKELPETGTIVKITFPLIDKI